MLSEVTSASSNPLFKVGFLGVGQIVRPMVERLVGANWPAEVFVRHLGLRVELEAAGGRVAESALLEQPVSLTSQP
ncbi:MAG: hypothetical protein OSB03_04885 [Vicinamibacterales bacterium]|nr:hypothetical protein [Vicinamibacterales bacterium]